MSSFLSSPGLLADSGGGKVGEPRRTEKAGRVEAGLTGYALLHPTLTGPCQMGHKVVPASFLLRLAWYYWYFWYWYGRAVQWFLEPVGLQHTECSS